VGRPPGRLAEDASERAHRTVSRRTSMSSGTGASAGQTFACGAPMCQGPRTSNRGRPKLPNRLARWSSPAAAAELVENPWRSADSEPVWSGPVGGLARSPIGLAVGNVQAATPKGSVGTARWPDHRRAQLVVDARCMAIARRRPEADLVHHSDKRSQWVSLGCARSGGVRACSPSGPWASLFFTRRLRR
jgi:hypothetical protein